MFGFVTKKGAKKSLAKAFESKNFAPALEKYRALVERYPTDVEVLNDYARLLMEGRQPARALDMLARAIAVQDSAELRNNQGRAHLILADLESAEASFSQAVALDPNHIEAKYNLTICHREAGDLARSVEELKQLVESSPGFEKAPNDLAMYYEEAGDYALASRYLHLALQANPDYIVARLNAIRILCSAGHYEEAKEHIGYVREQGVRIEDEVDGGVVTILIHGNTFFQGALNP